MLRCTNKGCGKDFDPADNSDKSCVFHAGGPVFHEGLKSWSCCSGVNKPVLDFEEFTKIPGCSRGPHSHEAPQVAAPVSKGSSGMTMIESNGQEIYTSRATPASLPPTNTTALSTSHPAPPAVAEEEDDLTIPVNPGTKCRRKGCGVTFVSDEVNRVGDGEGTVCCYHPSNPIFHEGSKGYLCCKRRVLEFDEFLKIGGCKVGRHLFVPKTKDIEEIVDCRIDHYQTPTQIHISVYAKQIDQERSTVFFYQDYITLDLHLPSRKRFNRTLNLFGPIDPYGSTFRILRAKAEITLKKLDSRSWILLEKTGRDLGNVNYTFGVGGRVGTIGGKSLVLDAGNQVKAC